MKTPATGLSEISRAGERASLALAIVVVLVIGILSYYDWEHIREDSRDLETTRNILTNVDGLLSTLKDAETGQRGFLLTGKPEYLHPYLRTVATIRPRLETLRGLVANRPGQLARLDALRVLIDAKFSVLDQTIRVRRTQGADAALAIVLSDRGNVLMQEIRGAGADLSAAAYKRLGERSSAAQARAARTRLVSVGGSTLLLVLFGAATVIIGRATTRREKLIRTVLEKERETALKMSEERYRSLALATTHIVWTTTAQGEAEDDMPMWRAFTGQSAAEVKSSGWLEAVHPDERELARNIWSSAVVRRNSYDMEYRMRRHDGEYRWMSVHAVPVFETEGSIREWVGTCADITERKNAEIEILHLNEDLEKRVIQRTAGWDAANRELQAFSYSVSHDLRAPLRAIHGFSAIVMEEFAPQLPAEVQHYLEVISNNATQMGKLIDGLLAFSRLEHQPLLNQPVAPAELVRQALEELQAERDGRAVEIAVGDLPSCEGDPLLLRQVFVNLLSNALKYTRNRELVKIEVGAVRLGDLVRLNFEEPPPGIAEVDSVVYYVRDNGAGFDMRYVSKLFGVFQRLHRIEDFEGTGVGLANVQRIIQRHGGRVWAHAGVDRGASFYFTVGTVAGSAANRSLCA